jgi:RNA polymerase sigma-70 factor (ECF subfamily)
MRGQNETPEQRFTRLYQETRGDVLAYLARRSRTLEDATDALAETYAAAWRKLDELPHGDRARLWLFGAARNELRMAERRARAGNQLAIELASQLRLADGETPRTPEGSTAINEALGKLSRIDYEIVTLTAWEGLAPREIAAVLGLSANVVRIRLHRARSDLRGSLQQDRPELGLPVEPLARGTAT